MTSAGMDSERPIHGSAAMPEPRPITPILPVDRRAKFTRDWSLETLVPMSPNGTPLRGKVGSARRWIWERRGYGGTVKVFWDLELYPESWAGLEWRTSNDGRMYAALVRRVVQ